MVARGTGHQFDIITSNSSGAVNDSVYRDRLVANGLYGHGCCSRADTIGCGWSGCHDMRWCNRKASR
jgi:hypothetical protein